MSRSERALAPLSDRVDNTLTRNRARRLLSLPMTTQAPREAGLWRERAVLGAGIVSALALVVAAFTSYGDGDEAGRVELSKLGGEIADGVTREWRRIARDSREPGERRGVQFTWSADEADLELAEFSDWLAVRSEATTVGEALLAEAARIELVENDPERALATVMDVLKEEPAREQRAEARLRAIQLAVLTGKPETAREEWQLCSQELLGSEARGETSYLLLAALAAAPLLEESERTLAQAQVVDAWYGGRLALPSHMDRPLLNESGEWRVERGSAVLALAKRVQDLVPGNALAQRFREIDERRAARGLRELLGELPVPAADHWTVLVKGGRLSAWRSQGGHTMGGFFDAYSLIERLTDAANLPAQFGLDWSGEVQPERVVRDRVRIEGTGLAFSVIHSDPESFVRATQSKLTALRSALLVLAALSLAASFFTFRALRRERRLASLKTEFIAGVSHDLRTPLASILLMAENLQEGHVSTDEGRERYYGSIRREADRLRRLVDDVLDFSRIERGQGTKLHIEDVALGSYLEELRTAAAERVEAAGGELHLEAGELPASAPLDAESVRRAVLNLVDNALKHSESTDITLGAWMEGEHVLTLSVSDTGVGIAPGDREIIFRPFERLESGNHATGGSGLGLAIVSEVARAHGGDARAHERTGGGATFTLRLDLEATRKETL